MCILNPIEMMFLSATTLLCKREIIHLWLEHRTALFLLMIDAACSASVPVSSVALFRHPCFPDAYSYLGICQHCLSGPVLKIWNTRCLHFKVFCSFLTIFTNFHFLSTGNRICWLYSQQLKTTAPPNGKPWVWH